MSDALKPGPAHALMHFTVFVWGFTAILGRLISISAVPLVFYRLLVVISVMPLIIKWRGLSFGVAPSTLRRFAVVGVLVALHWLLFYGCIKYVGIAVAVLCLSSLTFFTALLEPLMFKRKLSVSELVLGFGVMLGVSVLVKVETNTDAVGLAMGMGSALFSASFGVLNGQLARETRGEVMTFWELLAATVATKRATATTREVSRPAARPRPAGAGALRRRSGAGAIGVADENAARRRARKSAREDTGGGGGRGVRRRTGRRG